MSEEEFISEVEKLAEEMVHALKTLVLNTIQLCLAFTFIERGIRMSLQWSEQRDFLNAQWGFGNAIATIFVFEIILGQLVGSVLVLYGILATKGCALLFGIIAAQTVTCYTDLYAFLCNVCICGALLPLLADWIVEDSRMFARIFSLDGNRLKICIHSTGRIRTVRLFGKVTFYLDQFPQITQNINILMCSVAIGFQAKHSAYLLALLLNSLIFGFNWFWTIDSHKPMYDCLGFHIFQTLLIIGATLLKFFKPKVETRGLQ